MADWLDCSQSSRHGPWDHRAGPRHPRPPGPWVSPCLSPLAQAQAAKSYRNRPGCHSKATRTSSDVPLARLFHPKQPGCDGGGPWGSPLEPQQAPARGLLSLPSLPAPSPGLRPHLTSPCSLRPQPQLLRGLLTGFLSPGFCLLAPPPSSGLSSLATLLQYPQLPLLEGGPGSNPTSRCPIAP